MMRAFFRLTCLIFLFVFTANILTHGQGIVTGSISGTLQDSQKAVITKATVTAVDQATNQKTLGESNSVGFFRLSNLPVGTYTVTVESSSFAKLTLSNVVVKSSQETALGTQTMSAGATKEIVTVEETPALVESQTSQITNTFDAKKTQELPIGNGFDSLALLVPGVASTEGAGFGNNNGARFSINGQRSRANNFEIDGQQNNDNSVAGPLIFLGNSDAIQELQVITNFDAQYGRNMGGVVNYITKAGSNLFHGSAFEYYTGDFTDSLANEEKSPRLGFCASGQNPLGPDGISGTADDCKPAKRIRYVDNQFGGALGGPILRNKLWFFGSGFFERQRVGQSPNTSTTLTPTPNGITQLKAAFPGNSAVNLLAAIGPTAVKVGNPTFGGVQQLTVSNGTTSAPIDFGTVTRFLPTLLNDYESTGRVDWQATDKDRVFGRYLFQQTINTNATAGVTADFAAGYVVDIPARSQQMALDWTHTFTSNFVNQGRFSYSRANVGFENGTFPGCNRGNPTDCPTRVNFTAANMLGFGMGAAFPQGRLVNVTQWQDNLIWTHGRHTLKFGGEYDRQRSPNDFLPNINGSFTFSSFNNFLQDRSTFSLTDGPFNFPFKEQDASWYVQDDWRIKPNLTLNIGLRWEFYQQAINLLHDITAAKQASSSPFWDPSLPARLTTVPHVPEDLNNFAPNVGFAWTPRIWTGLFGQDRTVIRGGFRVAYDPAFYNMFSNVASSAPVVNSGTNIQKGATAGTCIGCLPTTGGNGTDVRAADLALIPSGVGINPGSRTFTEVDPNLHAPYAEEWTFGVQRQLGAHLAAEVRYNGTHTVSQFQSANGNFALNALLNNGFGGFIPAGLTPCADPTAPGFGTGNTRGHVDCSHRNVLVRGNYAWSKYNGLQSALRIEDFHGLSGDLAYTYSHSIDNSFEVFSRTGVGGASLAPNMFNQNQPERASSTISFPNVFSTNWVYEFPWYKSQRGAIGHLLGGWEYTGTYRFVSGQLWTPSQLKGETGFVSLGDPTNLFSASVDNLRPILSSSNAPLNTVGVFAPTTTGSLVLVNPANCFAVSRLPGSPPTPSLTFSPLASAVGSASCPIVASSAVHWIYNDLNAATVFGNPFAGVSRNPGTRGQTVNNTNMGIYKNTQINERLKVQFRMTIFNVFNRQYRGVPDAFIDDVTLSNPTFSNNFSNSSGFGEVNATQNGVGRRRIQFGLKLIF